MTTKTKLQKLLPQGRKLQCAKCPIPQRTCDALGQAIWGEQKCVMRIVLREILAFHANATDKRKRENE